MSKEVGAGGRFDFFWTLAKDQMVTNASVAVVTTSCYLAREVV